LRKNRKNCNYWLRPKILDLLKMARIIHRIYWEKDQLDNGFHCLFDPFSQNSPYIIYWIFIGVIVFPGHFQYILVNFHLLPGYSPYKKLYSFCFLSGNNQIMYGKYTKIYWKCTENYHTTEISFGKPKFTYSTGQKIFNINYDSTFFLGFIAA
jgi:hypothetical protein